MRFTFDGQEFEQVDRPLFGEMSFFERQAGVPLSKMTETERTMLLQLVALRRGGVFFTWQEAAETLSPADFEVVREQAEPDPTAPAPEPATPTPTPDFSTSDAPDPGTDSSSGSV